jgi:hypothetical protein
VVSVCLSVRAVSRHCPDRQTYTTVILFSVTVITQLTRGGQQGGLAQAGGGGTSGEGPGEGGQHGPGGGMGGEKPGGVGGTGGGKLDGCIMHQILTS